MKKYSLLVSVALLFGQTPDVFAQHVPAPAGIPSVSRSLGLRECVLQSLENNLQVRVQRYVPLLDQADIEIEKAFFDPVFRAGASQTGYQHRERIIWAPSGAQLNRDRAEVFYSEISKQLITGGQIDLRYEDQRMENRLFRPDPEYYSGLNLLLTQPLLDGFGRNSSLYRVRLSKKNREISSRVFEQTLLNVAYEVEAAYWDLVLAIRLVDIQKQNLDLAQSLLSRNTERFDVGMLPSYEILENQSHVASRRENLLSVVNALEDANDRLATLMNLLDSPAGGFSFLPLDDVVCEAFEPSASDSLAVAFERRPDLKQASLAIERSDLRLRYVRNQSLPSLNLITGLGLHGFDHAYSAAHDDLRDDNTYDWRIGVVFEVPFGSRESRYQHRKAVLLRQQAADQMRSLQQRVLTDIREAVRQIQTDQERIPAAMLAREFAQQRMQVEESLFDQGMSTTHDLLEYQQTLALAQLDELRAQVDLRKAFSKLRFLEGRLLDEFGFEFVEPDIWEE